MGAGSHRTRTQAPGKSLCPKGSPGRRAWSTESLAEPGTEQSGTTVTVPPPAGALGSHEGALAPGDGGREGCPDDGHIGRAPPPSMGRSGPRTPPASVPVGRQLYRPVARPRCRPVWVSPSPSNSDCQLCLQLLMPGPECSLGGQAAFMANTCAHSSPAPALTSPALAQHRRPLLPGRCGGRSPATTAPAQRTGAGPPQRHAPASSPHRPRSAPAHSAQPASTAAFLSARQRWLADTAAPLGLQGPRTP